MIDGYRVVVVARQVAPLTPEDTLAWAMKLLQTGPFDRLPVAAGGRILGVVTAQAISEALHHLALEGAMPEEMRVLPIAPLVQPARSVQANLSLGEAALRMGDGAQSVPVVDADGRYYGMLCRTDLANLLLQVKRPASIGGMATPLGVYLTTGSIHTGAHGNLGLVLNGAILSIGFMAAMLLTGLFAVAVERLTGIPVRAALDSTPVSWLDLNRYDIWRHVFPVMELAIFMLLLRFSPLAGYHAAEHQVVHAVEKDRPLAPESVVQMPRAHPRCGTRFFAIGVLLTIFGSGLPIADENIRLGIAAIAILLWWRRLGHDLQNWVTTKPANAVQIQSAIESAKALLENYRVQPERRSTVWLRIWNMGLLQVMAGSLAVGALLNGLIERTGLVLPW